MAGTRLIKPAHRKKRSKLVVVILAPILIIVFIVGWSLCFVGRPRQSQTKQPQKTVNKTPSKQDDTDLIVIPPQEEVLAN